MYGQVRSAILGAFNEQELTPVRGGGFGSAKDLVSSPSEMRRLLRESDLAPLLTLAGIRDVSNRRWIADRTGRASKFLESLEPVDFGWNELSRAFGAVQERRTPTYEHGHLNYGPDLGQRAVFDEWIASKSDADLLNVYQLLGMGRASDRLPVYLRLGAVPMIRIRQRGKVEHVRGDSGTVFLPATRRDTVQSRVPVELAYFEEDDDEPANYLRSFYRAAGVARWNETARTQARLKDYANGTRPIPQSDDEVARHLQDLRAFVGYAAGNRNEARETFEDVPFLLTQDPDGELLWVAPSGTYSTDPSSPPGWPRSTRGVS